MVPVLDSDGFLMSSISGDEHGLILASEYPDRDWNGAELLEAAPIGYEELA